MACSNRFVREHKGVPAPLKEGIFDVGNSDFAEVLQEGSYGAFLIVEVVQDVERKVYMGKAITLVLPKSDVRFRPFVPLRGEVLSHVIVGIQDYPRQGVIVEGINVRVVISIATKRKIVKRSYSDM